MKKHPFQSMLVSIGLIQNRGMHSKPPFVTIERLTQFEESSEEQQHYLASHPGAECHIPLALLNEVGKYQKELSM